MSSLPSSAPSNGGHTPGVLTPIGDHTSPRLLNLVTDLLGGLLGGLSDRTMKTDVAPVRWDR